MQFFGKSDKGMKRPENQDSFITEQLYDNTAVCLVCDGMGGANGGSTASSMACTSFMKTVKKSFSSSQENGQVCFEVDSNDVEDIIKGGITKANTEIYKKAKRCKKLSGMGTTLVGAVIYGSHLYAVNIGDSRLYLISKDEMNQLTHDHSYVQALIDLGQITPEQAMTNPHKNIITKALGISESAEPDIFKLDLSEMSAEYILLCTDGLTNYVSTEKIHSIILEGNSLEEMCTALVDEANRNGGGDNITTVLIKVKE